MRDRTLIIMAVLFLTFSIGSGVNKTLEAGNLTMGQPMAPDLKQMYDSNRTVINGYLREVDEGFDETKILVSGEIKSQAELWWEKFEKIWSIIKSKIQDKKNIVVR